MNKSKLERLEDIVNQLKSLYSDLAFHRKNELITKRNAYSSSTDSSISGREKYATFSAADHTIAIWETQAEIDGLIEEKWLIKAQLEYGSES